MMSSFNKLLSPATSDGSDGDDRIGTSVENASDESDIIQDSDETDGQPNDDHYIEYSPRAFARGERDVVDQMEHSTRAMQSAIEGHDSTLSPEDQSTEFKAAFASTPGGLEEVALATDRDLIARKLKLPSQPTH